jgi:hypothetical protein
MAVKLLHDTKVYADNLFRAATNPVRLMPDFIIIGAQKCGTTSLYNYLVKHPNIHSAATKELHFFDHKFNKGFWWYRAHFPTTLEQYYTEHIAKRVAQFLPQVKLIVLLRNPVDRLYSQYRHKVERGKHEKLPLAEAIAREEERIQGEREKIATVKNYFSDSYQHFAYKARGRYAEQLEAWFSHFPREQFLILKSEDLYANPGEIYKQALEFLNVPAFEPESLKKGYKQYNKSKETPSKMNPEIRKQLLAYYEPYNQQLYQLVGRDFAWDR